MAKWKGLSTRKLIGGGANQTAMLEVSSKSVCPDDCCRCTSCQFMDGVLLYGAQKSDKIDKWLKADNAQ
jgi:hypothetical protein